MEDDDITYFYASRLPSEPAEGTDDIHLHPMEPRTASRPPELAILTRIGIAIRGALLPDAAIR